MEFIRTEISDVIICQPKILGDHRGYFTETFRKDLLEEFVGYKVDFCQDNESKSSCGVLRGMHYQLAPYTQSKLVRVTEGRVLDVAVDIRKGSPYFGKKAVVELSDENKKQLFLPKGFAHGFVVLSETATFAYKCDNYYVPTHDRGFLYNDDIVGIDWQLPTADLKLSAKDKAQPNFLEAEFFDFYKNLYAEEYTGNGG